MFTCILSRSVVSDSATLWTIACQAPLFMEFSTWEYWSGLPFPTPVVAMKNFQWLGSSQGRGDVYQAVVIVRSLSHVWFFVTTCTTAHEASLSFTIFPRVCSNSCPLSHDAIQPSHPLSPPSLPALNLSQRERVSSSHQVDQVLELQHQHLSFQWIFKVDLL